MHTDAVYGFRSRASDIEDVAADRRPTQRRAVYRDVRVIEASTRVKGHMRITHVTAHNWRNFKRLEFPIESRLFVVGPNASGKSNLLDLFRFLGDVAGAGGGRAGASQQRSIGAAASARCAACSRP